VRLVSKGYRQHFFGCRHFQVQRHRKTGHQVCDVVVGNVAPVFAEMGSDAVGAGSLGDPGGANRIRVAAAPSVPDRRHVIDIDAKTKIAFHYSYSLPFALALPPSL